LSFHSVKKALRVETVPSRLLQLTFTSVEVWLNKES
jgi:hypothetical protein